MFVEMLPGSIDVVVMAGRAVIVITDTGSSQIVSVSSDDMASALRTGKGFEVRGIRGVLRASVSPETGQLTTLSVEHRNGEPSGGRRNGAASVPFSPSDAAWMAALIARKTDPLAGARQRMDANLQSVFG